MAAGGQKFAKNCYGNGWKFAEVGGARLRGLCEWMVEAAIHEPLGQKVNFQSARSYARHDVADGKWKANGEEHPRCTLQNGIARGREEMPVWLQRLLCQVAQQNSWIRLGNCCHCLRLAPQSLWALNHSSWYAQRRPVHAHFQATRQRIAIVILLLIFC